MNLNLTMMKMNWIDLMTNCLIGCLSSMNLIMMTKNSMTKTMTGCLSLMMTNCLMTMMTIESLRMMKTLLSSMKTKS